MKLYRVTNGYVGDSYVHCLVIAKNEERAKTLASEKFKADAKNESYESDVVLYQRRGWDTSKLEEYRHSKSYWTNLRVECLCEDATEEFCSEVVE